MKLSDVINFALVVAAIAASVVVAKLYGDMAALKEDRKRQDEEARKAKHTALQSLLTEVKRADYVRRTNAKCALGTVGVSATRLPVDAFSTAFSAGTPGMSVGEDLLDWVAKYLTAADVINGAVDQFATVHSRVGDPPREKTLEGIRDMCRDLLPDILANLKRHLELELEKPSARLEQASGSPTPAEE